MKRSQSLFLLFLAGLGLQRLWELRLSGRNTAALLAAGGREHAAAHYRTMKALHGGWFLAIVAEVLVLRRRFRPRLAAVAGLLFLLGQSLRYAAIRTLGERWTTRVITLPGEAPVRDGVYRFLRHPNYLGVILEVATVPLIHSAYLTSLLFSMANALLLRTRIQAEEAALIRDNAYGMAMMERARFAPWG